MQHDIERGSMDVDDLAKRTAHKLMGYTSCAGCEFLYFRDHGYSNYTVENTEVCCALDKNPFLVKHNPDRPYNWRWTADGDSSASDNWPYTNSSRCERYRYTPSSIELDVDGEVFPDEFEVSAEAIRAVEEHSGRKRKT